MTYLAPASSNENLSPRMSPACVQPNDQIETQDSIGCFTVLMSLTFIVLFVLGFVLAVPIVLFMFRGTTSRGGVKDDLLEIIPDALMSEAEKRLFEVLEAAAPSFLVCPQVAMSAIVTRPSHQNQLRHRAAFSQKRLDFVLVDRETLTARLVVELDNSSHRHRQAEDAKRDEMLTRAGYPVLRVPVHHSYNIRELSVKVRSALERR